MTSNNGDQNKIAYPIKGASKCPHCGSEERIGAGCIAQLKKENKLRKDAYPDGLVIDIPFQEALLSPLMVKPEVPVLSLFWDVCAECFTMYCVKVNFSKVPVQMRPMPGRPAGPGSN